MRRPFLIALMFLIPWLARGASSTAKFAPSADWDAGVSVVCTWDSTCGGKSATLPGPWTSSTATITVSCPNNGLFPTAKCKAFRGTLSSPTAVSSEVSATSATPFSLDGPQGLSLQ